MQSVGRYRIEERIGQGAMADVFRAYDENIDRSLAIKILKREFRSNPDYVSRFLREARAAGVLSHPNIVTIYDVGEADGFPYIAMELLEGLPLDTILEKDGPLPAAKVIAMGRKLADALDYAHRTGVVHRDIKPSNIIITADGDGVKLLDFGIARVIESDRQANQSNFAKTQVGQVLGTPRYMSPEQALGLQIDGRTDLFSLGVVMYEAMTGQFAFDGDNLATLVLRITQSSPDAICTHCADCPKGLRFVLDKLLAKNPDNRFPDGARLRAALDREAASIMQTDDDGRQWKIPLAARLCIILGGTTALALLLAIGIVLDRQENALASASLTSGASISQFVANHAALGVVENAGLEPEQQDWVPVQAFITTAAENGDVRHISVVDQGGIVRASSDLDAIGRAYRAVDEDIVYSENDLVMTASGRDGLRFRQPIEYAGQPFGQVDLVLSRSALDRAMAQSRSVLFAAAFAIFALILVVSWTIAWQLQKPVKALNNALKDATKGNLDFRISHRRRDEFGELFDQFNALADSVQPDGNTSDTDAGTSEPALDATTILPAQNRAA